MVRPDPVFGRTPCSAEETKGHCFISDIEIDLVGARSKRPYHFRIKTVHSVSIDGSYQLIFIK
jgi:hypothetical protein